MNKKPTRELWRSILVVIFIILGATCGIVYYSEVTPVDGHETVLPTPTPHLLSPEDFIGRAGPKELQKLENLSDLEILTRILKNDEAKATISNLVSSHGKLVADTGIGIRGGAGFDATEYNLQLAVRPLHRPEDEQVVISLYDANVLEIDTIDQCRAFLSYFTKAQWKCMGEFERKEYRSATNDELDRLLEINPDSSKYEDKLFIRVERGEVLVLHGFAWNKTSHIIDRFEVYEGEYATIIHLPDTEELEGLGGTQRLRGAMLVISE
jgi:hypothetical protein